MSGQLIILFSGSKSDQNKFKKLYIRWISKSMGCLFRVTSRWFIRSCST